MIAKKYIFDFGFV